MILLLLILGVLVMALATCGFAVLKAPLLSLDARGQFGKAIVYSGWKGLKTARQHVTPANPQTAAQLAQRALVTAMVSAWKNYFFNTEARDAWNRWALQAPTAMSGFNGFGANVLPIISTDPDASYVHTMTEQAAQLINFDLKNIDDGAQADEAGVFEMWAGATPSGMTIRETIPLVGGEIIGTVDLGDAADIIYCKLRKDGYDRSGIFRATLEA